MLAAHGAVAFAGAQKRDQLHRSVETRDLIRQARAILMERHKISADRAFAVLLRLSQDTNGKLRDIADELTATGQLANPTDRRLRRPS